MARTKAFDKEEVLKKAVELFWQKGFHATSVQDLVNHLGINRASMYDTFGSKEELFYEALQLYKGEADKLMSSTPATGAEAKAFIRGLLQQVVLEHTDQQPNRGCFIANTTAESNTQTTAVQDLLCKNKEQFTERMSRLIGLARRDGYVSSQQTDEALARHLFAFFNGLRVLSQIEHDPASLQSMVDTQMSVLFGANASIPTPSV